MSPLGPPASAWTGEAMANGCRRASARTAVVSCRCRGDVPGASWHRIARWAGLPFQARLQLTQAPTLGTDSCKWPSTLRLTASDN